MTINHGKPGEYITGTHNTKTIKGYYLVLPNGDRHWMGETIHEAARTIDKACDKYLNDKDGWQYWVDYCYGYDVKGNLAWANADQSDSILHRAENI